MTKRQPPFADGTTRLRFVLDVAVATRDRRLLESLRALLGFGSIIDRIRPRAAGWQPMSLFRISSRKAHVAATIPWADAHLIVSHKRRQYELWRTALLAYEREHPRRVGRSVCSEPDCEDLVRGRGLCRHHYYRATGY